MTPAIKRCLCTLMRGSSCMEGGSNVNGENTSGCAGASKFEVMGSMRTASLGAVGSIKSGNWPNPRN